MWPLWYPVFGFGSWRGKIMLKFMNKIHTEFICDFCAYYYYYFVRSPKWMRLIVKITIRFYSFVIMTFFFFLLYRTLWSSRCMATVELWKILIQYTIATFRYWRDRHKEWNKNITQNTSHNPIWSSRQRAPEPMTNHNAFNNSKFKSNVPSLGFYWNMYMWKKNKKIFRH